MTVWHENFRRAAPLWISGGLVVLVLFVFGRVLRHGFLYYDDGQYIAQNEMISQGLTWAGVRWAMTGVVVSMWHPLTLLSHMLDVSLFGMRPGWHHFENAVLHTLNSVLLFHVLRRMTGSTWRAAIVAAIWAVHPLRAESVAWAAERKDVLSALFWLLTMLAYVRWVESPRRARYAVMLIVYALGLLSKPMLVTLPFALLLLDFWPLRRVRVLEGQSSGVGLRLLLLEKLPLLVLAAAATGMAIWSQGSSGAMGTLDQYPLWTRLVNAPLAVGMYLWTTTVPVNLAVIYPHPAEGVPLAKAAVSATVVLAISLAALFGWRRYPFVFAGWFWFLGTLVPVIGLVQVGSTSRADRYTYLPQIGLLIAAVWLAAALVERRPAARRAAAVAAAAIVLTLAGLCVRQVSFWRNPITLFSHTVEVSPLSSSAWFNLGVGYALNKQPNLAEPCFRRAAELNPLGLGIMQNWAASLIELERPEEAADVLKKLIDMDPNKPEHHYQLGLAYFRLEDYREAIFRAEEALRIDPEYLLALKLIAQSEQALGNEQPQE